MNLGRKIQIAGLACGLALAGWACSSAISRKPLPSRTEQSHKFPDLWRSLTTGKEYYLRIDKSHFYAQWVNLPPAAAKHGAYIHTACKLENSKWAGTSDIYMPCAVGQGKSEKVVNTCHLTLKIEIDSISNKRITGRAQTLEKFECRSCKVIEAGWANFEWVPAN